MMVDLSIFPEHERVAVEAMMRGDTGKVIAAREGVCRSAIARRITSAMRRVGAKNSPHLVAIVCGATTPGASS